MSPLEGAVMCHAEAASCKCRHELGHEGPHECTDTEVCNGAWNGSYDNLDTFEIVRLPQGGALGLPALLGLFGGPL